MINFWGYSISETRSINYDTNDKSMTEHIARVVPSSKLCIGCGGMHGGKSHGLQHPENTDAHEERRK